jgi:hypothetical protein
VSADLAAFLLARYDEDEAAARDAEAGMDRPWLAYKQVQTAACRHMGTWDPARVLAECEAKREIVQWYGGALAEHEPALRLLAAVYADHPDYDPSWRL